GILADRIRAEDRALQLERAAGEVLARFEIHGRAVVLPESQLRRVVLPQSDPSRRACAVRRAALELAHDVERRRKSRQAGGAGEERAELGLLPRSSEYRRWCETDVVRDR